MELTAFNPVVWTIWSSQDAVSGEWVVSSPNFISVGPFRSKDLGYAKALLIGEVSGLIRGSGCGGLDAMIENDCVPCPPPGVTATKVNSR